MMEVVYPSCVIPEQQQMLVRSKSRRSDTKNEDMYKGKENALVMWPNVRRVLFTKRNKRYRLAVFLDYDGTLTPIVDCPTKAILSTSMRKDIRTLAQKYSTAIVTGRKFSNIHNLLRLDHLYYAGSHGFDIRGPRSGSLEILKQVADDFLPSLQGFLKVMKEELQSIEGTLVEDNQYCICVHYRNVEEDMVDLVKSKVHKEIQNWGNLQIKCGKKVMEARPRLDWGKGHAVLWLLKQMQNEKKLKRKGSDDDESEIIPIYIGDDVSDEDAFKAISTRPRFVSIHVKGAVPFVTEIGRAVQQECRDRSRMPSSA
eukprot:TRINITY_DN2171_c0_g1_i4.p1 TRINITY_DN2171_c0_g1~~TRINITY_DN2171_c0_g1_i4.p1  ORF type:complete len:313 (-),score=37.60 TRINITY_DN2171_c0_g1_i4:11-949(-)